MKNGIALYSAVLAALLLWAYALSASAQQATAEEAKVYVAVEGESLLRVFEPAGGKLLRTIDLSRQEHGNRLQFAPHNVQAAPDGKSIWVTANPAHAEQQHNTNNSSTAMHGDAEKHAAAAEHDQRSHQNAMPPMDEVAVIDPATDIVVKRIPIARGAHLAHVVVTADGSAAYVTAQNESAIYKINARNYRVERKIQLPAGKQPHGLRLAPDGSHAYIALLAGKGLGILDLHSAQLQILPLDGAAVQTAVTPDGKYALASLYDTKKLAVYDLHSKQLSYLSLPAAARGPLQIYPTPDSRYLYVADQGHYFGQPDGDAVFKVDLQRLQVVGSIKVGSAPHGIVVAKDGRFAYITNLASDDLSVIDLNAGKEIARLPAGKEPNGVSIWTKQSGGTP